MANLINDRAIDQLVKLYSGRFRSDEGKDWFQKKIRKWLFKQIDCRTKITQIEEDHPSWLKEEIQKGSDIYRFHVSEKVSERLKYFAQWIRSLERAQRSGDTFDFSDEARGLLVKLNKSSVDQGLIFARSWFNKLHEKRSLNKDIFSKKEIKLPNGKKWKRITSLSELHQIGESLHNCLRADWDETGGMYDDSFLDQEMEFWGLFDEVNPIAALRIDCDKQVACEFEGKKGNSPNKEMIKDLIDLKLKSKFTTEEEYFIPFGLIDGKYFGEIKPQITFKELNIYFYQNTKVFIYSNDHKKLCALNLLDCDNLEDVIYFESYFEPYELSESISFLTLIGQCLAKLKSRFPKENLDWELTDIIDTKRKKDQFVYWKDDYKILTSNKEKYVVSRHGISKKSESPDWFILYEPENGYVLRGKKFELLQEIENSFAPIKFWKSIDNKASKVSLLSDIYQDENGKPILTSAPTPTGWVNKNKGWEIEQKEDIENGKYHIKIRTVLDLRISDSSHEDSYIRNQIAKKKQSYAYQYVAFLNGEPEAAGVLRYRSQRQTEFYLAVPGRQSQVLASLLNLFLNESYFKIEFPDDVSDIYNSMISEGKYKYKPIISQNVIDEFCSWTRLYNKIIMFSENGSLVWRSTEKNSMLHKPEFFTNHNETIVVFAVKLSNSIGLRFSDEWKDIFEEYGYFLNKKGIPIKAPYPEIRQMAIGELGNGATAYRDIAEGLFYWSIDCEYSGIGYTLGCDENSLICFLNSDSDKPLSEMTYHIKTLIHALLDKFNKTMSRLDLGLVGLQKLTTGHSPEENDLNPLSKNIIPINSQYNCCWKRHGTTWQVNLDANKIAEVKDENIHIDLNYCPEDLVLSIFSTMKQALKKTFYNEGDLSIGHISWEEQFPEVKNELEDLDEWDDDEEGWD